MRKGLTYLLCCHRLCVEVRSRERKRWNWWEMTLVLVCFLLRDKKKNRLHKKDVSPPIMTNKKTHTHTHSLTHTNIQILPCLQYIKKCMSCVSNIFKPFKAESCVSWFLLVINCENFVGLPLGRNSLLWRNKIKKSIQWYERITDCTSNNYWECF